MADTNTAIPNGTGNFITGSFASPSQMYNITTFLGGGTAGQAGIYDDDYYGSDNEIVNTNTAIPGGTGNFSSFGSVVHSNYGSDAWVAGSLPGTGVYTNNGGPVGVIADTTTAIPGGTGDFTSFGAASHDGYDVAFIGNGSAGQVGLYTTTGGSLTSVISKGSVLGGKTVTSVSASAAQAINNGNMVFNVTFSDGSSAIYAAEQSYNWSANTSGTWDNAANWSFGLRPGTGALCQHPTGLRHPPYRPNRLHRHSRIEHRRQQRQRPRRTPPPARHQLTVNEYTYINTYGQITLNGSVFYANNGINNSGVVDLSGGQVAGGGFYNQGTVKGSGTVGNYFENDNYGYAVGFVQSLNAVVHFVNGFNNFSEYQIINSQVQIDGDVENNDYNGNGTGRIDVRNSILQFTNGLTNDGQFNFSFGTSDVFGGVTNEGDGQVIVSGNSNVTFYDAVTHEARSSASAPAAPPSSLDPSTAPAILPAAATSSLKAATAPASPSRGSPSKVRSPSMPPTR